MAHQVYDADILRLNRACRDSGSAGIRNPIMCDYDEPCDFVEGQLNGDDACADWDSNLSALDNYRNDCAGQGLAFVTENGFQQYIGSITGAGCKLISSGIGGQAVRRVGNFFGQQVLGDRVGKAIESTCDAGVECFLI